MSVSNPTTPTKESPSKRLRVENDCDLLDKGIRHISTLTSQYMLSSAKLLTGDAHLLPGAKTLLETGTQEMNKHQHVLLGISDRVSNQVVALKQTVDFLRKRNAQLESKNKELVLAFSGEDDPMNLQTELDGKSASGSSPTMAADNPNKGANTPNKGAEPKKDADTPNKCAKPKEDADTSNKGAKPKEDTDTPNKAAKEDPEGTNNAKKGADSV